MRSSDDAAFTRPAKEDDSRRLFGGGFMIPLTIQELSCGSSGQDGNKYHSTFHSGRQEKRGLQKISCMRPTPHLGHTLDDNELGPPESAGWYSSAKEVVGVCDSVCVEAINTRMS